MTITQCAAVLAGVLCLAFTPIHDEAEVPNYAWPDPLVTEASRGTSPQTEPIETIVERGYGLGTFYCGDAVLDTADRYREDVLSLFKCW